MCPTFRVHDGRLLDEDPRLGSVEVDCRAEARWVRAGGCRRDERCTEPEELVSLHDDGIASAALLMATRRARGRESEDLSADHSGVDGRQVGHLFANDPHFFAVGCVGGEPVNLFADCRSGSPAGGCFAKRCSDCFRVAQPTRPDDIECGRRAVIESDVERARHEFIVARIMLRLSGESYEPAKLRQSPRFCVSIRAAVASRRHP